MPLTRAYERLDGSWDLMYALGQAAIVRAAWSKRQLLEVMVDFWSNHLNVTNPHEACWWSRHDYDRRVIRKHALGTFSNMLRASATHPAMMMYLNNAESSRDNPNENYGREILELHSVGVDGGYDEEDMRQSTMVAHRLRHQLGHRRVRVPPVGSLRRAGRRDGLPRGQRQREQGEGRRPRLRRLPRPPSVHGRAHRSQALLPVRLGSAPEIARERSGPDLPRQRHRDRARAREAVPLEDLRVVGRREGSPSVRGRRGDAAHPEHQAGPAAGVDGQQGLYWMLEGLGHLPMGWVPPDGYPDTGDPWRSAGLTLGGGTCTWALAAGWWPANHLKVPDLRRSCSAATFPRTHGGLVDTLAKRLVFRKLPAAHRAAVLAFLAARRRPIRSTKTTRPWTGASRTWWRSSSTRPAMGSGDRYAREPNDSDRHRCPRRSRAGARSRPRSRGGRSSRRPARPASWPVSRARACSHASRSARRPTSATCWWCCRSVEAWTACRRWYPRPPSSTGTTRAGGPNIAVPQGQLLPLDASFGMHPSMAPLKPLYDSGSLGVVQAVGMATAQPVALLRDGGDGTRGARDLAAHRVARPRARPARNDLAFPSDAARLEQRRVGLPRAGTRARDVERRRLRPRGRVGRRGDRPGGTQRCGACTVARPR